MPYKDPRDRAQASLRRYYRKAERMHQNGLTVWGAPFQEPGLDRLDLIALRDPVVAEGRKPFLEERLERLIKAYVPGGSNA